MKPKYDYKDGVKPTGNRLIIDRKKVTKAVNNTVARIERKLKKRMKREKI